MAKKKTKKWLEIALVTLALIGLVFILIYYYYEYFNTSSTTGITNIGSQLAVDVQNSEEMSDEELAQAEERYLFEAKYYKNADNSGIEVQEVKLNYFTSTQLRQEDYRSTGMQFLGNYEATWNEVANEGEANAAVNNAFYYYDSTDGLTYSGYDGSFGSVATKLNRDEKLIINIDNKPFQLQLTGQYSTYGKILWWDVETMVYYYDYGDVFYTIMKAVKSNSLGYGTHYMTLDLSEYFTVHEYDETTKKFYEQPYVDFFKTYGAIKFTYEKKGLKQATQSLFGAIEGDTAYGKTEFDTDFWKAEQVFQLTINDLSVRYSEALDSNLYYLDPNKIAELQDVPVDIYLYFNGSNKVGLDYEAFKGLQINKLTLESYYGFSNFELSILNGAFDGTTINELQLVGIEKNEISCDDNTFKEVLDDC